MNEQNWEKSLVEKIALGALKEQRAARRWGIFFKLLIFVYLFALLAMFLVDDEVASVTREAHTAVVEIKGIIADEEDASAQNVVAGLKEAFKDKSAKGVILDINSPGGSPVHASIIYQEISRLKEAHPDKKVYAVASDICTSAAYYIASAADEVYADKATLVGSIGVLLNSFGFVDLIDKVGVERRLLTAGRLKGTLDPFSPVNNEEKDIVLEMLDDVHQQFIANVKTGRGDRLGDNDELFTGRFWTGAQAKELGLIDGFGNVLSVAREQIGEEEIVNYTKEEDFFERIVGQLGAQIGQQLSPTAQYVKPILQ